MKMKRFISDNRAFIDRLMNETRTDEERRQFIMRDEAMHRTAWTMDVEGVERWKPEDKETA